MHEGIRSGPSQGIEKVAAIEKYSRQGIGTLLDYFTRADDKKIVLRKGISEDPELIMTAIKNMLERGGQRLTGDQTVFVESLVRQEGMEPGARSESIVALGNNVRNYRGNPELYEKLRAQFDKLALTVLELGSYGDMEKQAVMNAYLAVGEISQGFIDKVKEIAKGSLLSRLTQKRPVLVNHARDFLRRVPR